MKFTPFFFYFFLLFSLAFGRFGTNTSFDGVIRNFNTYVSLGGGSGLALEDTISAMDQYTLSVWFKMEQTPWDIQRNIDIITVKPGFKCQITSARQLCQCTSDKAGSFQSNAEGLKANNWYVLVLRSRADISILQLREMSQDILYKEQQNKFFPYGYTSLSVSLVTLGIDGEDRRSNGFVGSIRNLRLFSQYYDDGAITRVQFVYIYPFKDLKIQMLINDINDYRNDASRAIGYIVGQTSQVQRVQDYFGNFWCWFPDGSDFETFIGFDVSLQLQQYTLPATTFSTTVNYNTTLQVWFKRSITTTIDPNTSPDESLFNHQNAMNVRFLISDYSNMRIDCVGTTDTPTVFAAGFNRWLFLQVSGTFVGNTVSLYELDGSLIYSKTTTYSRQIKSSSRNVNIGVNYNGVMFGLKYYKNSNPPTNGVYAMKYAVDSSADCLMYFVFTQKGLNENFAFKNWAQQAQNNPIGTNTQLLKMSNQFYREYGSTNFNGTINHTLSFDGYTCSDLSEKLQFSSGTSYASTDLSLNSSLSAFTVEFWVRPTNNVAGPAFFLALQDQSRDKSLHTVIKQETDRNMYCYPLYQIDSNLKLQYLDYRLDSKTWLHIACSYDAANNLMTGMLFQLGNSYVYFRELTNQQVLPQQQYKIYLNTEPATLSKGIPASYYQELRFWSYSRSQDQIKNFRYQQLDVISERVNMYAYWKFMSGSLAIGNKEIDYSDYSSQKQIELVGTKWLANTEMLVCPLGMYKSSLLTDMTCYREGLQTLQILVYKQGQSFIVSPRFSVYLNPYLRDNSAQLFDYQWRLLRTNTKNNSNSQVFPGYFNPQAKAQEMIFTYGQVSDRPGEYEFSLDVIDKEQHMNMITEKSFVLRTVQCASIFDQQTQESLVYVDMENKRAVEDAIFYYDFTECDEYRMDQDSIQIWTDANKVRLYDRYHNKTEKSFTLPATEQTGIPINEYFTLVFKGVWRNISNPKNDYIEYSLIYSCRFIQKLVIQPQPNYYMVLKGQTLIVDYKTSLNNLNDAQGDRSFTVSWKCEGNLQRFCQGQNGALKLFYQNFIDSGQKFWQTQNIRITARTNFIQGDGLKYSTKTVQITWIDVNPDAYITMPQKIINNQNPIAYEMVVNNMREDSVSIKWTTKPAIDRRCYMNSNSRKQFVIQQSCLTPGMVYFVTGAISYNLMNQQIWNQTVFFTAPEAIQKGRISCTKNTGRGYIDGFNCSAPGFSVRIGTLRYQYFISDLSTGQVKAVSALSTLSQLNQVLPPTKNLTLKVYSSGGAIQYANLTVNITSISNLTLLDNLTFPVTQSMLQKINQNQIPADLTDLSFSQQFSDLLTASALVSQMSYSKNQTIYNLTNQASPQISQKLLEISKALSKNSDSETKKGVLSGVVQSLSIIGKGNQTTDKTEMNTRQETIVNLMDKVGTDTFSFFLQDKDFQQSFLQTQENVLTSLLKLQLQGNISDSLWESPPEDEDPVLSNVTAQLRSILSNYEEMVSKMLFEGENYQYENSAFQISINKYSRMANVIEDAVYSNGSSGYAQYNFPLQNARQPTNRQSFSVINFKVNPFLGMFYLNQSATSNSSVYFSYRDQDGKYLNSEYIPSKIKLTFKYNYNPFAFLPNDTACGYINTQMSYWENNSCTPEFNRAKSEVTCHCRHMSYYSIIDDYLQRPSKVPLVYIVFRNWASFIVFLYVILIVVIGIIYTINKDNQDFRYLHNQEEQQGNELTTEDCVTLVSLTLKRKVFFMTFSEKYSFQTLFRLYIMLLHPVFQLKYRMDPQLPRVYRFIMLYSRVVLIFALSFFLLKDYKNFEDLSNDPQLGELVASFIIFNILASILLVPVPIFLLCCCKSRYYLLNPKSNKQVSDNEADNPDGVGNGQDIDDRWTGIPIDTDIPIKLLFLVNAVKNEEIQKEHNGKLKFCTGNIQAVGNKLYELDLDIQNAKTKQSTDESEKHKTHKDEVHTNSQFKDASGTYRTVKKESHDFLNDPNLQSLYKNQIMDENFMEEEGPRNQNTGPLSRSASKRKRRDSNNEMLTQNRLIIDPNHIDFEMNGIQMNINELDDPEENLDESQDQYQRRNQQHEGGEEEPKNKTSQQDQEEEDESDMNSIDTDLFIDEKKELIEVNNIYGKIIGCTIAFCFNIGLIIAVIATYVSEGYYNLENRYVWVISFFITQVISFCVTDMITLYLMALSVTKCLKAKKSCLARWMRESLYIYEDYKYVVQFTQTKIS